MVRKLYKHEFLAWLRVMPIIYAAMLGVSLIHRGLQFLENDSVSYALIIGSASLVYFVALIVCAGASTVFGIVRFYKNMFTGEGYLTHTLPVRSGNHLWVKLLTAVCFDLLSLLVILLSAGILCAGDMLAEVRNAVTYLLGYIPGDMAPHIWAYIAELLLMLPVLSAGGYLMYYTCICIGQLFRKNRVLAAIGVYFGIYLLSQFLSTVMSVIFMVLGGTGALDVIVESIIQNPKEAIHIYLLGFTAAGALLAAVYFLVCHHIIRKRLNLE